MLQGWDITNSGGEEGAVIAAIHAACPRLRVGG